MSLYPKTNFQHQNLKRLEDPHLKISAKKTSHQELEKLEPKILCTFQFARTVESGKNNVSLFFLFEQYAEKTKGKK